MDKISVQAIGLALATFVIAFLIGNSIGYVQGLNEGKIVHACEVKGGVYTKFDSKVACYSVKEIQ